MAAKQAASRLSHPQNPQTGGGLGVSQKHSCRRPCQEEQQQGDGQADGKAEPKAPCHSGAHYLALPYGNGGSDHPRHRQADARGGQGHRQHKDGENQLVQPHPRRPHLLREEGAVAHVRHAQQQGDRRERGPLDEKFSLRHSASGCKGMGNQV